MMKSIKTICFNSALGPRMNDFREAIKVEKRSKTIFRHISQLDRLCVLGNYTSGILDEETVMAYRETKSKRGRQEFKQSQSSIRQFAYFLVRNGYHAFIPPAVSARRRNCVAITFSSCLAVWIEKLVAFKQSLGFKYNNERKFLHQFDEYLVSEGFIGDALTKEMVNSYSIRPDKESPKTRANKLSVVKILGEYMNSHGGSAFLDIPSIQVVKMPPYVFSHEEILRFFRTVDKLNFRDPWMAYTVPVYFRLLYSTGIRESECCGILRSDIDYDNNRILVRHAKMDKDRYVYFSPQDAVMLRKYDKVIDGFFSCRETLFIGGIENYDALTDYSIRNLFRRLWKESGGLYDRRSGHNATVHSFRHTYVVDKLAQWQQEGYCVDSLIPYLSKQLGHKTIAETYYYCTRLDTRFSEILADEQAVVPEVSYE